MPIEALPPTTVRAIGSTSTISDPCSIVKELLDNALDAFASSVSIEISQDTVSVIQVKDNGHGIPKDDYAAVCKRGFTSKIQTIEDLNNVGGKSLGFRGEALASAADVSAGLTVVTKTEAEPVGSSLKYGRDGELLSAERASHPVGTTVQISGLFKHIPVRRQASIKDAKKATLKIRKMIQAYAMARPTARLSFKILKAKTTSGSWMYAPGKEATHLEAARQVVGVEVASMCLSVEWPMIPQGGLQAQNDSPFRLTALLPKPGSDFTLINNKGYYINVDGRPMASGRGIAQDIIKLYKACLRSASLNKKSLTITDPFLYLQVNCPAGVYDVNVEPLKDDLLFENKAVVLSLVETLLHDTYGGPSSPRSSISPSDTQRADSDRNAFEALLPAANSSSISSSPINVASSRGPFASTASEGPRPSYRSSLVADSTLGIRSDPFKQPRSMRSPNAIPTLDAAGQLRTSQRAHNGTIPRISPSVDQASTPYQARRAANPDSNLPSPISNMSSPPSNDLPESSSFSRHAVSSTGLTTLSPATPVRRQTRQHPRGRNITPHNAATIDSWIQRVTQAPNTSPNTHDGPEVQDEPSLSVLAQQRFSQDISPTTTSDPDSNEAQSPNTSLGCESPPASAQGLSLTMGTTRNGRPHLEQWSAKIYAEHNDYQNAELQKAMDFERRKKAAIQERRMQLQNPGSSDSTTNSPHRNRFISARAALTSESQPRVHLSGEKDTVQGHYVPVLSPHDPRAYLKRLLDAQGPNPANGSKLKRFASNRLPFEKVPAGHDLHSITMNCSVELPLLSTSFTQTSKTDLYNRTGHQNEAFSNPDSEDIELWRFRLAALITAQYTSGEASSASKLRFDFSQLL
ncbi:hypothetical protein BJX64DRAFT_292155 [Aspergillus heterothallicus]